MPARTLWLRVGLSVLSALLFGLAFPTRSWRLLGWVALAPLLVAVAHGSRRQALLLTWIWSLVAAWSIGDWFPRSVSTYFEQPMAVAAALFFAVFSLMAAPYYMAAVLAWRVLARRFTLALPFLGAAAWVMAELGRGALFTGSAFFIGNPWGLLGYSHADVSPLVQVAAWTGIYGVSFLLACPSAALAQLALTWRERGRRERAFVALALSLLPAAAAALHGWLVLERASGQVLANPVTVAIAQGNIDIGAHWRSDAYGQNLDVYLRLSDDAARRARPAIAFWPESSMTFFLEREPAYQRALGAFLAARDLQLVAGAPRMSGDESAPTYSNSVYVVEPGGALAARYDKEYLVPFAEYFPIGVDVLRRSFGRIRYFAHGAQADPLPTRAGPAGILVCNESMLPEAARARVRAGAVYLVNPSNDTWISDAKYTEQQLDIASLRALEQRRWLVRASTAGPSALIDPWGRVSVRTPALERGVAVGAISARSDRTPYAQVGDAFALACTAAVLLALLRARRRSADTR